jgi:UDP-N-acetyl-D-mannosaminuronic acid dehydrogenase
MDKNINICIMGLGYIGLPTAALLANCGYNVRGVDVVAHVVETINRGEIHIVEPDLDAFVHAAVMSGKLKAALQPAEADIFMIAVPTPFKENFAPDLTYVLQAAEAIVPYLKPGNTVILESTSPVGTTEQIAAHLQSKGIDTDAIFIAYCPERVLPGHVMKELIENDRIVGGINPASTASVAAFYKTFVKGDVLETDARTAEMCKLTENASRDVSIAFANELSMICDRIGINVWELIRLANKHPRVNILRPGPGVGGHCIAVDPWFIVSKTPEEAVIIRKAREINDFKTKWSIEKIQNAALEFELKKKRKPIIAIMGLAFKPDIDDLRESPALAIYKQLAAKGHQLLAVEPNLLQHKEIDLHTAEHAVQSADIIVFLVAHKPFGALQFSAEKQILDFCGVFGGKY